MNAAFIIAQQGAMYALWWLYVSPDDYFACINPIEKVSPFNERYFIAPAKAEKEREINKFACDSARSRSRIEKKKEIISFSWFETRAL